MQQEIVIIREGFDDALWKAGVEGGAFSGLRDPAARWFALEADGKKLALASAVPGPGELTSVSYFVVNEARGRGYATVLASNVCDRFEKASFLVMKDNDASVKVALKALRDKFSMVMGHNTVRLTKEAADDRNTVGTTLEGKIHESFTVTADKMYQAGMMSTKERIALSGSIGDLLGRFRKSVNKDVSTREMTDRAHDLLKKAVSERAVYVATRARQLAQGGKPSGYRLSEVAHVAQKTSPSPMTPERRKAVSPSVRFVQATTRRTLDTNEIAKAIRGRIDPQEGLL